MAADFLARAERAERPLTLALRVDALRLDTLGLAFFFAAVALLAAGGTAGAWAVVAGAGAATGAVAPAAHSGVG